jgi:hypothetical protein
MLTSSATGQLDILSAPMARQATGREGHRAEALLRNLFLVFMAEAVIARAQADDRGRDVLERPRRYLRGTRYARTLCCRCPSIRLRRVSSICLS